MWKYIPKTRESVRVLVKEDWRRGAAEYTLSAWVLICGEAVDDVAAVVEDVPWSAGSSQNNEYERVCTIVEAYICWYHLREVGRFRLHSWILGKWPPRFVRWRGARARRTWAWVFGSLRRCRRCRWVFETGSSLLDVNGFYTSFSCNFRIYTDICDDFKWML